SDHLNQNALLSLEPRDHPKISLGHYSIMLASSYTVKSKIDIKIPTHYPRVGFNSLVHSLRALSTLRRSGLRTASAAAKPCQGDYSKFYLITGTIGLCGFSFSTSCMLITAVFLWIKTEFDVTDLGALNYFLGILVTRDARGMFLSQKKYAMELLERALFDSTLYHSLACGLQYLTFTRPYISYVVQQICLHMHYPREPHLPSLKRVLRYIRGTLDHGLQLHVSSTSQLNAYTDVDWAGCHVIRRSTSGYCVFFGDNLLSWFAKRQVTLSRSSVEAEYRGVANVVAETAWIRNLLRELHNPLFTATLVYCDNVSAVYMSTNHDQHQRTKHIEIDIHFVRDTVARG
nr:ribonuclease H-like domain-containing protein [Tanacetum cinerariifolium]